MSTVILSEASIALRAMLTSRRTLCVLKSSTGLEGNSQYEHQTATVAARTPRSVYPKRKQTRGLSTPRVNSQASPLTSLKMTGLGECSR